MEVLYHIPPVYSNGSPYFPPPHAAIYKKKKILPEKLCESVYIFKKIRYTVCGKMLLCLFLNTFSKENKTYDVPGN